MNVRISFASLLVSLMIVCGFGFARLNSMQQISVINNTNNPVGVSFPVPGKTIATIQLKKINDLYTAITSDSASGIRAAVSAGANVNQEINGKTPLVWTLLLNRDTAFRTLLELGAKPDDVCAKYVMSKANNKATILLLIRHGYINFDIGSFDGISRAGSNSEVGICFDLIKELTGRGVNVNWFWLSAILFSSFDQSKSEEAINFLLSHGANPNGCLGNGNVVPLLTAITYSNKRIIGILLDAGADINSNVDFYGCQKTLLDMLLEANMRNPQSYRKEIIEFLRERGVYP